MPSAPTTDLGYTPPDGGWGWVVVFGAFISIGFSYAFPKALTIYFKEIQEYFSVSYSDIAWISSIMLAAMYAGGVLVDIFGDYMYMHFMSGAVMFASGLFLFVMNFWNYRLEESKTRSQKGAVEQAEMKRLSALEQGSARGADGFEMPEQEEKGEGDRTRVHPLP